MVQSALVVSLVGCALAGFLPSFVRALRVSKVSEAAEHLALMHESAAAYFAAEHETEQGPQRHCLPPPAGPMPAAPTVEPTSPDWASDPVWAALGFAPERHVRFSYTYEPVAHGCGLRHSPGTYLVTFRAQGDLDGDGERSMFERRAAVNAETGVLEPLGILYVRDRVE